MIRSHEVEDASPTSAALQTLERWLERVAEKEVARLTANCARYEQAGKPIPVWVRAGTDERFRRVLEVEQRIQMLLGIFAAHGVLPLKFKPAHNVADLLVQHLDQLEQEAQDRSGVQRSSPTTSPRSTRWRCRRGSQPDLPCSGSGLHHL